jgi:hypothetical protein
MPTFEALYTHLLDREINQNSSLAGTPFASTNRQQAVNDGYQEFAALTECWQRRSTVTVSCNTAEYVLSTLSEFSRISAQGMPEYRITSSGSSGRTTIYAGDDFPNRTELWNHRYEAGWRQSTTPGTPRSWYLRADGGYLWLGLDTRPDVGSSEAAAVVVPYIARPTAMTASTQVPFTDTNGRTRTDLEEYHQAFAHYAAYKLLPLMGDTEGSEKQLQKFLGYVTRFWQNLRPRGGSHVTMGRDYLRSARRDRGEAREPGSPNYR